MYKKVCFYIGADNETGKVGLLTIEEEFDKKYEGYTIINTRGMWNGVGENSVIVECLVKTTTDYINDAKTISEILKQRLEQEAVIFTIQDVEVNFI